MQTRNLLPCATYGSSDHYIIMSCIVEPSFRCADVNKFFTSSRPNKGVDCLLFQEHDGEWGDHRAYEPGTVHINLSSQHAAVGL